MPLSPLPQVQRPDVLNTGRIRINTNFESIRQYINALEFLFQNNIVEKLAKAVNQTNHGFALGDVVRFNGVSYEKSYSNAAPSLTNTLGIVSTVTDADNFIYTTSGIVDGFSLTDVDNNALTVGETYYVANAVSIPTRGKVSATKYTHEKAVLTYLGNNRYFVFSSPQRTLLQSQKPYLSFSFATFGSHFFAVPKDMTLKLVSEQNNIVASCIYSYRTPLGSSFTTVNFSGGNEVAIAKDGVLKITLPDTIPNWDDENSFVALTFEQVG